MGVDIDAAKRLVDAIKPLAKATARPGTDARLGGFGALFDLGAAGFKDPLLVASTDGVGTKVKIAQALGQHASIGIDLVAMCVNDVVVQGAEPLFFLDYFATSRLQPETARAVVAGIAQGCREAGCALVGGETAEMPGMYSEDEYDLAGFCVGAAERGHLLPSEDLAEGDVVLGLASSGPHANGFSLIRRVVADQGLDYRDPAPFAPDRPLGEALLEPTRIYVKSCLAALGSGRVRAFSHITGGAFVENIPRVLPPDLAVRIDASRWPLPEVFVWLARSGGIAPEELARTFNCGIGMAAIVAPEAVKGVKDALTASGEAVFEIGRVVERRPGGPAVMLKGVEKSWPGCAPRC